MKNKSEKDIAKFATHQLHGSNLFNAGQSLQKIVNTIVIVMFTLIVLLVIVLAADDLGPIGLFLPAVIALTVHIYILILLYRTGKYLKLSVGKQISSVTDQETSMFCGNCGTTISDKPGKFCEKCGSKL